LDEQLYARLKELQENYDNRTPFWKSVAQELGTSGEALRSEFRREQDKRAESEPKSAIVGKQPKIVIFDIETLPMEGRFWGGHKQYISPVQVTKDSLLLSWSCKDFMRGEVRSQCLTPKEIRRGDDVRIVEGIWKEFCRANILVSHNGDDFDIPFVNSRVLFHNGVPPTPYLSVDTYKILKYNFRLPWYKLDYVNRFLGLTRKVDSGGFELWNRCAEGDTDALDNMEVYNRQDTLSLEELYVRIRAWDKRHPNIGLYFTDNAESHCRICGSTNLEDIDKPYCSGLGVYQPVRCMESNCGAIGRRAKSSNRESRARAKEFSQMLIRA
jgi:hypothetical protein